MAVSRRKPSGGPDKPVARKKPLWAQPQGTPEQLPMFMTGREIQANYDPMHGDRRTSPTATGGENIDPPSMTWKLKLSISKDKPAEDSYFKTSHHDYIAEHGVEYPVHLSTQFGPHGRAGGPFADAPRGDRREVLGGHHRIAAQTDIDPERYIPVLHHENFQEIEEYGQHTSGILGKATWKYR